MDVSIPWRSATRMKRPISLSGTPASHRRRSIVGQPLAVTLINWRREERCGQHFDECFRVNECFRDNAARLDHRDGFEN